MTMRQAQEYLSALVSMELSARLAELEGRRINSSIRATCKALRKRIKDKKVLLIIRGVEKQFYPLGAIEKLRRELDSCLGGGK